MTKINIETMAEHYIIAAIWADCPEGTQPRATNQAKKAALGVCTAFAAMIEPFYDEIRACTDYGSHPDEGGTEAAIGHDLYLTSACHGVGFWDREKLSDSVKARLDPIVGWRKPIGEPEACFMRGWMYLDVQVNGVAL